MLLKFIIATILVSGTVLIHSLLSYAILRVVNKEQQRIKPKTKISAVVFIDKVVLLIVSAALIEATIWAFSYYSIGALDNLMDALYFPQAKLSIC